jgi:hypothetical protein
MKFRRGLDSGGSQNRRPLPASATWPLGERLQELLDEPNRKTTEKVPGGNGAQETRELC